jgi:hypothetical protein
LTPPLNKDQLKEYQTKPVAYLCSCPLDLKVLIPRPQEIKTLRSFAPQRLCGKN